MFISRTTSIEEIYSSDSLHQLPSAEESTEAPIGPKPDGLPLLPLNSKRTPYKMYQYCHSQRAMSKKYRLSIVALTIWLLLKFSGSHYISSSTFNNMHCIISSIPSQFRTSSKYWPFQTLTATIRRLKIFHLLIFQYALEISSKVVRWMISVHCQTLSDNWTSDSIIGQPHRVTLIGVSSHEDWGYFKPLVVAGWLECEHLPNQQSN